MAPLARRPLESVQEQAVDSAARHLPAGADGLGAPGQSVGPSRDASDAPERRYPGLLDRGGLGPSTWCVHVRSARERDGGSGVSTPSGVHAQHMVSRRNSIKHGREIESLVSARVALTFPRRRASTRALCLSRADA